MEAARNVGNAVGVTTGEGHVTKMIESRTSRIPSGAYLAFAILSMAASATLMLTGQRKVANFVGQWAPTVLIMGLYNKLVKLEGSQ